ncbi:hypothetical protein BU24DRAFT_360763 [Aaosphaeria arxii CBS 175.79]|uniref:Rhodopsin domain-containing protein n=1 Tax=Aaosphaeria arxii CBS 175.79 TaxID=1450172 RepID=A0A6A5Y6I3_9PLEO|nr:uncharacterized protein BU24DRAFT_360763 [Aaosphaeria arxii CBS 175.79]KAF2020351.1 hypothetical protein BU24DRAFT_360763 [Aaosphaeria arxii CBS 175.79]
MLQLRNHEKSPHMYIDPSKELNAGLWTLFAGATVFLALRFWIKIRFRHGLWYDDHILLVSWIILAANNAIISAEYATGYVTDKWDDRMHILINISSCGTLLGQALTKTAFAVTLLKLTKEWYKWILWFCIGTMNLYMVVKIIFQWAKVCEKPSYDVWYRLDFCLGWQFREDFKEGGNIYNIVMDFVFATFPWIITWNLDMRRVEKIGLCVTMSLGMIVAIVAAVRTGWKDQTNVKDEMYFWRNAHSNVWYSSEIVGTIIVQCIPVLRPLLRDMHSSFTSRRAEERSQKLGCELRNKRDSRESSHQFLSDQSRVYSVHCWAHGDELTLKPQRDAKETVLEVGEASEEGNKILLK